MNKGVRVVFLLALFALLLGGCQYTEENRAIPAGINYPMEGVPEIGDFSGEKYEDFRCHFAKVKTVTLYMDGTAQSISPTDERVIRLLNFIAYSLSEKNYSYTTGLVRESEINEWYNFSALLEVEFEDKDPDETERIIYDQKILISGNSYLQLLSSEGYAWAGEQVAEQKWPYMALFRQTDETGSREDQQEFEALGIKPWIDLLVYAGFKTGDGL